MSRFVTERIDDEFLTCPAAATTYYSKVFDVRDWNQKLLLIMSDQQVVVSIMYTFDTQSPPAQVTEFFVLTTANAATLAPNFIIPYGVEDPVHFVRVKVETQASAAVVRIQALGSRG